MANASLYKEYDINGLLADFSCAYAEKEGIGNNVVGIIRQILLIRVPTGG